MSEEINKNMDKEKLETIKKTIADKDLFAMSKPLKEAGFKTDFYNHFVCYFLKVDDDIVIISKDKIETEMGDTLVMGGANDKYVIIYEN